MSDETTAPLTDEELAALRSLPVRLSLGGTLTHLQPHAGTIRALEARGLVIRSATEVARTPQGDAELAYAGGAQLPPESETPTERTLRLAREEWTAPLIAERDQARAERDHALTEARRLREALESARARFERTQQMAQIVEEVIACASLGIRDIDAALSASPDPERRPDGDSWTNERVAEHLRGRFETSRSWVEVAYDARSIFTGHGPPLNDDLSAPRDGRSPKGVLKKPSRGFYLPVREEGR